MGQMNLEIPFSLNITAERNTENTFFR